MIYRVKDVCESGERLIKCLDHQMRQKNRATETAQELICTFRLGVRKLVHLKGEVEDLKKTMKELQLAEQGLDSRSMYVYVHVWILLACMHVCMSLTCMYITDMYVHVYAVCMSLACMCMYVHHYLLYSLLFLNVHTSHFAFLQWTSSFRKC